jgi:hypothetical protein
MSIKPECEIISGDESNFYDYWKTLVKRKNIFIGILFIPLVIVSAISLNLPRYYRGGSEISYPVLPPASPPTSAISPASNIVKLIGNIDDTTKVKIFTKNSDAITNVSVSLAKSSADNVNILIDAKTADIIPQAFNDIRNYINNLPEIKEELARIKEDNDLKIKNLIRAKKTNLFFLNQITEMIKEKRLISNNINPADLIKKDFELSLEIRNLQDAGVKFASLGPISITMQPSNSQIRKIIISTGFISILIGILAVFFLEYIDRMKAREK